MEIKLDGDESSLVLIKQGAEAVSLMLFFSEFDIHCTTIIAMAVKSFISLFMSHG